MRIKDIKKNVQNQQGGIFVTTVLVMSILIILGSSLALLLIFQTKKIYQFRQQIKAHYFATAGIERTIASYLSVDLDKDWSDNSNTTIYSDEQLGDGSYTVSSKQANTNSIVISSIGRYNDAEVYVHALVTADWLQIPPQIHLRQWQEQKTSTLQLIN